MPQNRENIERAACERWEALLADVVDGELKAGEEAWFGAHMAACPECAALFEAARRGREWLEILAAEPETPMGMLERILAQTGPGHEAARPAATAGELDADLLEPWQQPGLGGFLRRFAEPRLMLTAATAFFSIALTINMAAPRVAMLKVGVLRPAAVRSYVERQLATASVPIVRYYEHLRLVNEVQSAVRQLQRTPEGAGETGSPDKSAQPAGTGALRGNGRPKARPLNPGPAQQAETVDSQRQTEAILRPDRPARRESGSATGRREGGRPWTA